jgi:hypothetical protein
MPTVSTTHQRWTERLARYHQAKQTVADFCAAEGISQANFYFWKRKLALAPRQPPALVPIQVTPPPTTTGLELVLPSGAVLRFPATSTPTLIAAVLRSFEEERPC